MHSALHMYLYTLAQYQAHFACRPAICIEAEGPATSSALEPWPALVGALGLGSPFKLDAPVRGSLCGTAPLVGVIDYATANFVGLRTRDALIRFHGRAGLGMTVAVSHHAYSDLEAEHIRHAWEAWLAEAFSAVSAGRS